MQETAIHETADGRRYLVLHGDSVDFVIRHARWLAHLGDAAYDVALFVNRLATSVRRRLGLPYWSLSAWAKLKVKNAVNVISAFEDALVKEARKVGAEGVICGHIHHAVSRRIDGIHYLNTGDWVESLTALVEHADGAFEIIRWGQRQSAGRRSRPLSRSPATGRVMRNPMRILLATDAWEPQVNGVVKTLQATTRELRRRGHASA